MTLKDFLYSTSFEINTTITIAQLPGLFALAVLGATCDLDPFFEDGPLTPYADAEIDCIEAAAAHEITIWLK